MSQFLRKYILLFFLLISSGNSMYAQSGSDKLTRMLFIFDFSNSMNAPWESSSRINIAKKLIINAVDSLKDVPNLELALRLYGHQTPLRPDYQDCNDTKLEVPFSPGNHDQIKQRIQANHPKGTTPIAISLEKAGGDFPADKNVRNVIILITDGIEACNGDPCAIAKALRSKNINVKPFIIGVGMDLSYLNQFECIGSVFDASTEGTFKNTLNVVLDQAIHNTTAQINLLDINKRPVETNVAYTIYNSKTGEIRYNYVHTMNKANLPDTVILDAASTYKIVVHTIPQVVKDNITLTAGKHNIIEIDAPQGYLDLKVAPGKGRFYGSIPCIVRKKDDMQTLNVQYFSQAEKYLVGTYDLEILTLPRIYINDFNIAQSIYNKIEIPAPGTLKLNTPQMGYGSIFSVDGGKQEWVYTLKNDTKSLEIYLQPGKYKVVYRIKKTDKTLYTIDKSFTINSTQTTTINL